MHLTTGGERTAHQAFPEGEPAVGHYRQALVLADPPLRV